jgi:hypothetical protein
MMSLEDAVLMATEHEHHVHHVHFTVACMVADGRISMQELGIEITMQVCWHSRWAAYAFTCCVSRLPSAAGLRSAHAL